MQVVIYYAGPKGVIYERDAFDVDSIAEARGVISNMFMVEYHCAEWNVRTAWMSESMLEAHVYGYCKDERVDIILEDTDKRDYLTEEMYTTIEVL